MRHTRKVILVALILGLITVLAHATSPQEYKESLLKVGVILSENDEAQVTEWLLDKNSGYPDLAEKLLSLLNNTRPKGKTTVLDAVMGKYRIVNQKSPDDYIAPPYKFEMVKEAYVKNWKERNSGEWKTLAEDLKNDYKKAFACITNPNVQ